MNLQELLKCLNSGKIMEANSEAHIFMQILEKIYVLVMVYILIPVVVSRIREVSLLETVH